MKILNEKLKKAGIIYPVEWKYRIIGTCINSLRKAVDDICGERNYSLKNGNQSKTGKFISVEASLIIINEFERNELFMKFKMHSDIKMVL